MKSSEFSSRQSASPAAVSPRALSRREFIGGLAAGVALGSGEMIRPNAAPGLRTAPPQTYTNPVYSGSMPDPFVLRHRGVYYAFGTTGAERKPDGRVYTVLCSTNLVDWQEIGGALEPPTPDPAFQYWAPEVAYDAGTFYLYYSTGGKEEEKFEIRVATSRVPQGPYRDAGLKLLDCENNRFTIDAHPFRDADGRWYMFYARNFLDTAGGARPGTALVVDRLVGMTRLAGECRAVLRARHPWTLYEANRRMDVYNGTFDWHTIEGAFVRRRAGRYYLFYSGSNWQTPNYGVDYAVADRVTGPYAGQGTEARVLRGVPGKVRGPGHHSIVVGPDGKTEYFVYHAWDEGMRVRRMCIDRLAWTSQGPRLAAGGPTYTPQPRPALH